MRDDRESDDGVAAVLQEDHTEFAERMPGGEQVFKGELDGISEEGQIVNKFNKAG
jgi:hypothetical protein